MSLDSAPLVIPISTPYSSGTGFYLPTYGWVVTSEHLVRDNAQVIVSHPEKGRMLLPVIYLDPYYDLALLATEDDWPKASDSQLTDTAYIPKINAPVTALGRPSNGRKPHVNGAVIEPDHEDHGIKYIRHDAWLDTEHAGGPLIDEDGQLLGINFFDYSLGKPKALTLPAKTIYKCLKEFQDGDSQKASRCDHCKKLNFELGDQDQSFCISCGHPIQLPSQVAFYRAEGIQATIEEIIQASGHDPRLTRQGPNLWQISHGSARIMISYHEDSGLLTGDAHLCHLPESHSPEFFEYLLRQNFELEHLTFSTRGRDVILSLLIFDRYLSKETALPRIEHLLERADYYDNILVERFGAEWGLRL
ncbi:MAG: serine protease [Bacteroidota bacterium]